MQVGTQQSEYYLYVKILRTCFISSRLYSREKTVKFLKLKQ